jgi:hypothetical protein
VNVKVSDHHVSLHIKLGASEGGESKVHQFCDAFQYANRIHPMLHPSIKPAPARLRPKAKAKLKVQPIIISAPPSPVITKLVGFSFSAGHNDEK